MKTVTVIFMVFNGNLSIHLKSCQKSFSTKKSWRGGGGVKKLTLQINVKSDVISATSVITLHT